MLMGWKFIEKTPRYYKNKSKKRLSEFMKF